jgi:hypothetical protein
MSCLLCLFLEDVIRIFGLKIMVYSSNCGSNEVCMMKIKLMQINKI